MQYTGKVVMGDKQGRVFGFPTANIEVNHHLPPGVYAGFVYAADSSYSAAVIVNPDKAGTVLEAHILDFDGDLYGKEIIIHVGQLLREWMDFPTIEEGQAQIRRDIENIRKHS